MVVIIPDVLLNMTEPVSIPSLICSKGPFAPLIVIGMSVYTSICAFAFRAF